MIVSIGRSAVDAFRQYCDAVGATVPSLPERALAAGEALVWDRSTPAVHTIRLDAPRHEHRRHIRKYAHGALGEDRSFYFRGPRGALNLRAQNLTIFLQLAAGVDDETWMHHLRRGDYSRWFREAIDDHELAAETQAAEQRHARDPRASREAIREAVNRRYTAPAEAHPA